MNIVIEKSHRIDREISAPEVRPTGAEGEMLDIAKLFDALRLAEERDVDLVEIAPTAQLPVCRLMDYDKSKYQEQKKAYDAKLKQEVIQVKKVKFRLGTDDNDCGVKLCNATRSLEDGDRVEVTLRFRGRETAHQELGMRALERIKFDLEEFGRVEQMPKMEGHQAVMMLAPKRKK